MPSKFSTTATLEVHCPTSMLLAAEAMMLLKRSCGVCADLRVVLTVVKP